MAWCQQESKKELYESEDTDYFLEIKYYDHDELGLSTNEEIQEWIQYSYCQYIFQQGEYVYFENDVLDIKDLPNFLKKGNWELIETTEYTESKIRKLRQDGIIPDRTLIYYREIDKLNRKYFVVENYTNIPNYINYYFCTDNDEKIPISQIYTSTMKKVYDILNSNKYYYLKTLKNSVFRRLII